VPDEVDRSVDADGEPAVLPEDGALVVGVVAGAGVYVGVGV
jgi:hypothetical protein